MGYNTDVTERLSRRKKRQFKKAKTSGADEDFNLYKDLKRLSRSTCQIKAYNEFMKNIISPDAPSNPKRFWAFIRSMRCDPSGVHPLKSSDGKTHIDSTEKANILNDYFCSVFTKESDENTPDKGPCPHPSMKNIIISSCARQIERRERARLAGKLTV